MTKFFSFDGRARRSEYWGVQIVILVAFFPLQAIFSPFNNILPDADIPVFTLGLFVVSVWLLFSVTVRRLRDAGINLGFTLLTLVPIVGVITWIIWGCIRSDD